MPTCAFPTCKKHSGPQAKRLGISFHRFPSDGDFKLIWTRLVQKARINAYWKPHERTCICSEHFEDKYIYLTNSGIKKLVKNAIPTKKIAIFADEDEVFAETEAIAQSSSAKTKEAVNVNEKKVLAEAETAVQPSSSKPEAAINVYKNEVLAEAETSLSKTNCAHSVGCPQQSSADSNIEEITLTPRKAKLMKSLEKKEKNCKKYIQMIKNLKRKLKRQVKKNESLKNILKNLKNNRHINEDVFQLLSKNIVAADLFNNIYQKAKKNKKRITYSMKIKKFCLTLNFLSPNAYKYVRATFDTCMPHPKTLAKWYSHINGEPGFTEESFVALKEKAAQAKLSNRKLICALMADEMSIRNQSLWDGKKDAGYIDVGSGPSDDWRTLASEAYVLLLNGINEHFKLPLGYFLVHGLDGQQKANLINLCLRKCHEAGVTVISLTFDGHSTNTLVMNILGCNIDPDFPLETSFKHPVDGSPISIFLDPVHMIKLIRNILESKKILRDENDKEIRWEYLNELVKLQEEEGLHIANKLTRRHIQFRNNIMKVKLAAQVFSQSVCDALNFCRVDGNLSNFKDSAPTETFISNMNKLFDIFNSRNFSSFDYKQPLNKKNQEFIFSFLEKMDKYIRSIKIKNRSKRTATKDGRKIKIIIKNMKPILECKCKIGFLGMLINIKSLKTLYNYIVETNNDLSFLPLYKCSQDHLELLFGLIRMHGGHNDNPNAKQFKGIYRKVLCNLELKAMENGNCISLEHIGILNCSSTISSINSSSSAQRKKIDNQLFYNILHANSTFEGEDKDLRSIAHCLSLNEPNLGELSKYVVGYISGNVARSLTKSIKCTHCTESLLSSDFLWFHKLIGLKDRGGLCYPSQNLYDVCRVCEQYIRKITAEDFVITSNKQRLFMVVTIFKKFLDSSLFCDSNSEHVNRLSHRNNLIRAIIEKYLNIRLYYISKCKTLSVSVDSKRQLYKKLTQQKGT